jgi:hypothetical protein
MCRLLSPLCSDLRSASARERHPPPARTSTFAVLLRSVPWWTGEDDSRRRAWIARRYAVPMPVPRSLEPPPPTQRSRHVLTREDRARGGRSTAAKTAADYAPWERGRHMRHLALARWSRTTADERRLVGRRLLEARRQRVPMILSRAAAAAGPAQRCDVCQRTPARAYAPHALRTHAVPTWRCARHASAPRCIYGLRTCNDHRPYDTLESVPPTRFRSRSTTLPESAYVVCP